MRVSILTSILFFAIIGCGGSEPSNVSAEDESIVLMNVPPYQLLDTNSVLAQVSGTLTGLAIDEFFAQSYEIIELRNFERVYGDGRYNNFNELAVELNDISDEFYVQTIAVKSLILERLQSYDQSSFSDSQKLSFDIFSSLLSFEVEAGSYRDFEYPATYGFFGWPGSTESFFIDIVPVTNKEQAEIYLTLLNQIGRRFKQIEDLVSARQVAGIIEPKVTLEFAQQQVAAMAGTGVSATSYYRSFVSRLSALSDVTDSERQTLTSTLSKIVEQRVLPAYASLSAKMASLLPQAPQDIGFGQFEGGLDYYDFVLKNFTSSEMTADEVHQLGLEELERIHNEMRVLFEQLGYPENDSTSQLLARANADSGTILAANAVDFYESLIESTYAKLPTAFSTIPVQDVVVIGGNSGGYYIRGSDDGTRPGAFYAYTAGNQPYLTMPTLAYHEAVPGHHLQIALANEADMPRFRRETNFTSFVEGWGLYAERLAKDLGWYEGDIFGDIGRLQFEALRASRLVIDTGIHHRGWTFDEATAFSQENIGQPGSIARYSVWPGQATAYTIGMLKILALREQAETQLGPIYDIKRFHDVVIGDGSMPLQLLEQKVNRYIADSLNFQ